METINANTKIAALLKQHPEALEAIISLSPRFTKLRNPLLRKLMASRTSIGMASKIGGCTINDFFNKLQPLGFVIDKTISENRDEVNDKIPGFMVNAAPDKISDLDVRQVIESGKDPLNLILDHLKKLEQGKILKLINSFEPVPLILLLNKQGYESYTEIIDGNVVNTYFHHNGTIKKTNPQKHENKESWETTLKKFEGSLKTVDVRELEMPLPMLTILEELDNLPANKALFVYHKRVPVFLLPELADRELEYRIKEINDSEVHMLIFKP